MDNQGDGNWLSDTWTWVSDHFYNSDDLEVSVGWQGLGGLKGGLEAYDNIRSAVILDGHLSNRGGDNHLTFYNPLAGERQTSGWGVAFLLGIESKTTYQDGDYQTTKSFGLLGIFGLSLTEDSNGHLTNWFWGIDVQLKGAVLIGASDDIKFGFADKNQQ